MNKQELIEKIEEVKETLEQVQSVCYLDIRDEVEKNCEAAKRLCDKLAFADSDIDSAIDNLEEALELVEELPDYEYRTTYAKAVSHITNKILCNNICEIDEMFEAIPTMQSEEGEKGDEIFQYYLTDCTESDVEWLCENYERMMFEYSNLLDMWVLMVDHFGTAWDYVFIGTHNKHDEVEEA